MTNDETALHRLRRAAIERGLRLLSTQWKGHTPVYHLACPKGHEFTRRGMSCCTVRRSAWSVRGKKWRSVFSTPWRDVALLSRANTVARTSDTALPAPGAIGGRRAGSASWTGPVARSVWCSRARSGFCARTGWSACTLRRRPVVEGALPRPMTASAPDTRGSARRGTDGTARVPGFWRASGALSVRYNAVASCAAWPMDWSV
ncbi:hypothetical protein B0G62_103150 [Paraburkholderia eburnea]|uniref:Uncharacterized protein n=1 Tax=Paraburkholderia eburnea TaxID=1189126 RepID=A0A2S4MFQ7_9BURK|nr:hypothetical protein B0G62_103150 [Paraburkholderia eburnea]PRZ25546.1 hypothetical protein BX588_102150 [Paraburkholderia eburnea]